MKVLQSQLTDMRLNLESRLEHETEIHQQTARQHADRILELEQSEIKLKEEKQNHAQETEELVAKCSGLDARVSELMAEISNLKIASEEEVKKIEELKDGEITHLKSEIVKVQEEKDSLKNSIGEHMEKMEVYRERIATYEKEITKLEVKTGRHGD